MYKCLPSLPVVYSQFTPTTSDLDNTTAQMIVTVIISWTITLWKFFLCGCIHFADLLFLGKIERLASRVKLTHDQALMGFSDFGFGLENLVR
jgi:hypothetical protein